MRYVLWGKRTRCNLELCNTGWGRGAETNSRTWNRRESALGVIRAWHAVSLGLDYSEGRLVGPEQVAAGSQGASSTRSKNLNLDSLSSYDSLKAFTWGKWYTSHVSVWESLTVWCDRLTSGHWKAVLLQWGRHHTKLGGSGPLSRPTQAFHV